MNPTARACVWWAVGLFVLGALVRTFSHELYRLVAADVGLAGETGLALLNVALGLVDSAVLPVAAALVGAAVVVQALRPSFLEDSDHGVPGRASER